jgi:hypothetical protein
MPEVSIIAGRAVNAGSSKLAGIYDSPAGDDLDRAASCGF